MRMRTMEFAVGIFMVLGISSLLMLALQVSGLSDFFREDSGYKIKLEFANLGGLKVRSKVSVAGVPIGRVVNITLNRQTYNAEVLVSIDKEHDNIPVDSRASIMTAGLLGDNYIGLSPGFEEDYLKEGDKIDVENTDSAVILEQLISKFVTSEAGSSKK